MRPGRTAGFRDQLIAASLKPFFKCEVFSPVETFPRSIDRGLIEARYLRRRRTGLSGFRDQLIAASLKLR